MQFHKIIKTDKAPAPIGPYNQATLAGHTLYVSGQIAIDPATNELIENPSIANETHQVMNNLGAILKKADATYSNIVKCSIFIRNMDNFQVINKAYGEYFDDFAPARETVEVSGLPKNVNVEISCIAYI